jgi:hypothetical protein
MEISGVVVRPANIRELADIVYKEYCRDPEKDLRSSVKFILRSSDGTQYEDERTEIFSEGGGQNQR